MNKNLPTVFVVAAALVNAEGQILIAQRPEGKSMAGLWEFPGGKIHESETPEAALVRELEEELGIQVSADDLDLLTRASHAYDDFHLVMPLYLCRTWHGTPRAIEHKALAWVKPAELDKYPMPPADIPLISLLRALQE